jgi:hypothetical protein
MSQRLMRPIALSFAIELGERKFYLTVDPATVFPASSSTLCIDNMTDSIIAQRVRLHRRNVQIVSSRVRVRLNFIHK